MSYVHISRRELEEWLNSLPFDWERVEGKEGIYHINCSDMVAIKLSSTQTQHDEAMGKGHASMNLSLVSKLNGWVLNKKARDRKRVGKRLGLMVFFIGFQNTAQSLLSMRKLQTESLTRRSGLPSLVRVLTSLLILSLKPFMRRS